MIVECWVRVPKGSGSPFPTFRDHLFGGLGFLHLHGEDPTIAFLPKDTNDSRNKPPMLISADFPLVQCNAKHHYLSVDSAFAFSTVNNKKGRHISFSVRMGFNTAPDLFLAEMASDLEERNVSFKRKAQQAMDVDNAVVLWGAPQFMCPRDGKAIIDSYLIPLEKEMMKEDPQSFPAAVHNNEDSKGGSDIDMQEAPSVDYDDNDNDNEIEQTLIYMICSAAPDDDLLTMDTMLDQLEAEQFDTVGAVETAAGIIRGCHMVDRWDIQDQPIMPRC